MERPFSGGDVMDATTRGRDRAGGGGSARRLSGR